ncbi:MAG: septal ring lytic transglycosylase RlpA family protein [Firmicutes bacterium]|nr:septal ring lytic transglycosylase RlpA family protein [Bacillota bacterium]
MVALKKGMEVILCLYLLTCILVIALVLLRIHLFSTVEVVVNDAGRVFTVKSRASCVGDLLAEQEIDVNFHDKIYPGIYAPLEKNTEVIIVRTVPVVLSQAEATATYYTAETTVEGFLEEVDVPLDGSFFVTPLLESPIVPGMEVNLVARRVVSEFEQQKIPYDIKKNEDKELPKGRRVVVQEGREGIRELEYRVVYAGDLEVSRELVQERIIKEPVSEVVNIGTGVEAPPQASVASRGGRVYTYRSEGLASWYGEEFQGKRTSSGQVYDQYGFTAAHPSLPFGTLVKVTFLKTGKSVEVTINDRGPLKGDRIIDLSSAAAEAIGLKPYGVGRVKVEVVEGPG